MFGAKARRIRELETALAVMKNERDYAHLRLRGIDASILKWEAEFTRLSADCKAYVNTIKELQKELAELSARFAGMRRS